MFCSFRSQASWSKKRRIESDKKLINIDPSTILDKKKNMFCWGSTVHGELGLGGIEDENILVPRELDFKKATQVEHSKKPDYNKIRNIKIILKFSYLPFCCRSVACGENYTIVITKDGQLYSCGNNDHGQLGHEKPRKRLRKWFFYAKKATTTTTTTTT